MYIAIGGAIGATGRYLLSDFIYNRTQNSFPLATFTVNILACFFVGMIYAFTMQHTSMSPNTRLLLNIGFLGAFSTFSTFSLETMNIIRDHNLGMALLNISSSVVFGLLAVWLGYLLILYLSSTIIK